MKSGKIIKYGLKEKETKQLLYFETYETHSSLLEGYPMTCYELTTISENDTLWLMDTVEEVERVMQTKNIQNYSDTYSTPKHNYDPDSLEIIKIEIKITIDIMKIN